MKQAQNLNFKIDLCYSFKGNTTILIFDLS